MARKIKSGRGVSPRKSLKSKARKVVRARPVLETLTPYHASPDRVSVEYSFELSERICARLANGEAATALCRDRTMPDWGTLQRWIRDKPDFARRYRLARESGYEYWADDMVYIADNTQSGEIRTTQEWGTQVKVADMLEHRRLRIDARKWLLAKRARSIYGDKDTSQERESQEGALTERLALINAIVELVQPKKDGATKPAGRAEEARER